MTAAVFLVRHSAVNIDNSSKDGGGDQLVDGRGQSSLHRAGHIYYAHT